MTVTFALIVAAISVGSIHTLAPDHWVPFAAIARAERWPAVRTAVITTLCGLGHVTVSVALGLASAMFGLELLRRVGQGLESIAGFAMIAFGVAYGLWGIHRSVRARWHTHDGGHVHWHRHNRPHVHVSTDDRRVTAWTLFLLFSADPCVAVIPLMFAAAPLGWASTLAVVGAYEAATIGTMVGLVLPARVAASAVHGNWADRYGDAMAGGVIAAVGLIVVRMGW
jgi:hypothetical protein